MSIRLTTYARSSVSVPFYDALGYERRSIVYVKYVGATPSEERRSFDA